MKVIGVIPARYQSARFPGKILADICGKPMIWWVFRQAAKVNRLNRILVAADDQRIIDVCDRYGIPNMLTRNDHDTPTSRLYEVSQRIEGDSYIFIGGDEPLIEKSVIETVVDAAILTENPVVNAMTLISSASEVIDYTNIKVVTNTKGYLLYCSRSPLPYPKGGLDFEYKKFVGTGAFSRDALEKYNSSEKSKLEKIEECDLIRFLELGIAVKMVNVHCKSLSVDTPKDLDIVTSILERRRENQIEQD